MSAEELAELQREWRNQVIQKLSSLENGQKELATGYMKKIEDVSIRIQELERYRSWMLGFVAAVSFVCSILGAVIMKLVFK